MRTTETDFFTRKQNELAVALNPVQRQAVLHTEGALLLLASPGSGKTTTIIMRIGYLIEEKGVRPSRIKAVTFSRASAQDMKERFQRFFPDYPQDSVRFSTIHSLAFEVVREYLRKSRTEYRLIEGEIEADEEQELNQDGNMNLNQHVSGEGPPIPVLHKKYILRHLYKSIVGEHITDDQMEELTTYISFVKNKMLPASQWSEHKCDVPEAERLLHAYEAFKRTGTGQLLLDYDDMLTIAGEAFEKDRGLLRKYQQRYDYVLTDESQDTSKVQHAIIEKLVQVHGNLCVVADDDQSIYAWRAAEPQYLLDFKQVYPRAKILKMEQNYRSSRDIVHVANRFIKRNKNRYDKNMFTDNRAHKPIVVKHFNNYTVQSKYVADKLAKLDNLREAAVLYRNKSSSIVLMNDFDRAGIPFYMKDGDTRFFSHWVVEDVLNFMRMSYTDRRPDLFEKIHTKVNGYVTKQQVAALKAVRRDASVFDNLIEFVPLQDYQVKQMQDTKETFAAMNGSPPLQAIRTIRYKLGYEKALDKMCERLGFRREDLIGILNTLEDIADTLESMEDFAKRLKYLEALMKTSKFRKHDNVVTLSTLHSAKGLEFERVYMIDLVEGIIPSGDDQKKYDKGSTEEMEEAVRLFYVGMTRAKRHLELLSYKVKNGAEVKESQFVEGVRRIQGIAESGAAPASPFPAPKRFTGGRTAASTAAAAVTKPVTASVVIPEYMQPGKGVEHRVFGRGEIVQRSGEVVEIRFAEGVKRLSVAACLQSGLLKPV